MSKLSYKVSYYILYAIFAAIIIVLAFFYLGGQMAEPLVPVMDNNPAYTNALLYLLYGLLGLTVLASVVAAIAQFAAALKDNPAAAIKSLIGVILLVLLLVVSWAAGSDKALEIPGYDGTANKEVFWLKLTDMFIYSLYFLVGINVVGMIVSGIKRRFS